jgi:asparagine synthase (glutamine-hydrolysing)
MCGIAGMISQQTLKPADVEAVVRMNRALMHRGPDGAGFHEEAHVVLAMRRLSIIDLQGGQQPIYNEDRSIVVVANGEIYNYIELRADLEKRGHQFRTHSDCETIAHLYEEHGEGFVSYLRGMFAIALWDSRRQRLVLARDRMGEKPLYYREGDNKLVFASEMKSLLAAGHVPFKLDPVSVNLYFHYNFIPEPATALENVRKLDAGHMLTMEVKPWRITERQYWRMDEALPLWGKASDLIRQELERVSELVIRSDVPVGVALSGGVDSSAVAALAAKKYPGKLHAFCVGYPDSLDNDERADARRFADYLGIPFHEQEINADEMVDSFPELVFNTDDPVADYSGYSYFAVMRMARQAGVPVVLQGQGGDELFMAYPAVRQALSETRRKDALLRHDWHGIADYFRFHTPRGAAPWQIKLWIKQWCGLKLGWDEMMRHRRAPADQIVFYDAAYDFIHARSVMGEYYGASFASAIGGGRAEDLFTVQRPWPNPDILLTRLICDTYLRGNGVVQGDRLSMASSVEMRLPLLDHGLVETIIGLRKRESDRNFEPKQWLKEAVADLLPSWVLNRPKRGFTPPVRIWHRMLFARYGHLLQDGYLVKAGVLKPEKAAELVCGPYPDDVIVPISFKALVLEVWCLKMEASGKLLNE